MLDQTPIPQYFLDRASRPIEPELKIVPSSTPVVSFGNPLAAKTVTIGINPSSDEFCSRKKGKPLLGDDKTRLLDRSRLKVSDNQELTREQAREVVLGCFDYFGEHKNPYHWFKVMDRWVNQPLGVSYYKNEVAHLDLVQWATSPVWQGIESSKTKAALIASDLPFLARLLNEQKYDRILLNGATVLSTFQDLNLFELAQVDEINHSGGKSKIFHGMTGSTQVFGWTMNIPAKLTNEAREMLAGWIANHASK